jgi:hypothetical protein
MPEKIKLAIEEEYGYREWVAYLDKCEYDELIERWKTMKGLHCMVPVTLIIPQAVPALDIEDVNIWLLHQQGAKRCHIHEYDDSYLEGADYAIPPNDVEGSFWPAFEMDGESFTREDLESFIQQELELIRKFDETRAELGEQY